MASSRRERRPHEHREGLRLDVDAVDVARVPGDRGEHVTRTIIEAEHAAGCEPQARVVTERESAGDQERPTGLVEGVADDERGRRDEPLTLRDEVLVERKRSAVGRERHRPDEPCSAGKAWVAGPRRSLVDGGGCTLTSSRIAPTELNTFAPVALSSKTKARAPARGATTTRTSAFSRTSAGVPSPYTSARYATALCGPIRRHGGDGRCASGRTGIEEVVRETGVAGIGEDGGGRPYSGMRSAPRAGIVSGASLSRSVPAATIGRARTGCDA